MLIGSASPFDPEDPPSSDHTPASGDGEELQDSGAHESRPPSAASLPEHEALHLGLPGDPSEVGDDDGQDHTHAIGEVLDDRYEILEVIGKGGMGRVYRAFDRKLGRPVAIKRPLLDSERFLIGFSTEAKAAGTLQHPNICYVLDRFDDEWGPCLVMEYCSGGNLQQLVQREGPLQVDHALDLALGILYGLRSMHQNQVPVIHRDVKPANILLDDEGQPKLTDFGLAKRGALPGMSREGYGQGTPGYWAPEQQRDAKSADARSDLYSFGMTLRFLLTGSLPAQPPAKELPGIFVQFIKRCTRDYPEDRFQSAQQALDELQSLEALVRTPRGLASPQVPGAARDTCPDCGERNEENRRFCWNCQRALIEACPNCHTDNRHWERVCGNCGVDRELWNRMLGHIEQALVCARGDEQGASYEEALDELEEARRLSRGRAEFEVLAEQTRDRIEFLRTTRDELEELWRTECYEQAVPLLEALLEAWPADGIARKGLSEVPALIRRRELRAATGALRRAVATRNLAAARRLLRDVRELAEDDRDGELLDARRSVEKLEAQLTRESLLRLEAAIAHERWDVARGALARLAEIGVDAQLQRDSRLRILASRALADGELYRARRLLASRPAGADSSPWADDLRARLRDLENERLDHVRGTILGARKSSSLARARRKLVELSEELGVERSEQILELEQLLRRRRRGLSLRELGVALGVLLMLGGVAGGLLLNRAMDVRERAYLGEVLEWAIDGKPGGVPEREADEWRERLPVWLVELWARPAIEDALVILKRPGALEGSRWSERVALLAALPSEGTLAEARRGFLTWNRGDLRARFRAMERPQPYQVLAESSWLALPPLEVLDLPGVWIEGYDEDFEVRAGRVDMRRLDGRSGSFSLHPPDLSRPNQPDELVECSLRLAVDVTPPAGRLVFESPREDRERRRLVLDFRLEGGEPGTCVEVRVAGEDDEWRRVPRVSGDRLRLELDAPEPFASEELAWRLVDEHGNSEEPTLAGSPVHELFSFEEEQLRGLMEARAWAAADALLFGDAAALALEDPGRRERVDGLRAELRAALLGGEPGPSVQVELGTSSAEWSTGEGSGEVSRAADWRGLGPGENWVRHLPLALRMTTLPVPEDCRVEYERNGRWLAWPGAREANDELILGRDGAVSLQENGEPLRLRIGAYEVLRDQWFELELIHDDRKPVLDGDVEFQQQEEDGTWSRVRLLGPETSDIVRVRPERRYRLRGAVVEAHHPLKGSLLGAETGPRPIQISDGVFAEEISFVQAPWTAVRELRFEDPSGLGSNFRFNFAPSLGSIVVGAVELSGRERDGAWNTIFPIEPGAAEPTRIDPGREYRLSGTLEAPERVTEAALLVAGGERVPVRVVEGSFEVDLRLPKGTGPIRCDLEFKDPRALTSTFGVSFDRLSEPFALIGATLLVDGHLLATWEPGSKVPGAGPNGGDVELLRGSFRGDRREVRKALAKFTDTTRTRRPAEQGNFRLDLEFSHRPAKVNARSSASEPPLTDRSCVVSDHAAAITWPVREIDDVGLAAYVVWIEALPADDALLGRKYQLVFTLD